MNVSLCHARIEIVSIDKPAGIVFIRDLGIGKSVTNDAEYVPHSFPSMRVIYQDTTGEWWEIIAGESDVNSAWVPEVRFERWFGKEWDLLKR